MTNFKFIVAKEQISELSDEQFKRFSKITGIKKSSLGFASMGLISLLDELFADVTVQIVFHKSKYQVLVNNKEFGVGDNASDALWNAVKHLL